MKICVLIKQVASEDSSLVLDDNKMSLNVDGLNLVSNEPDTYALEEALQMKEKTNGEVVVCTFGNESSKQVIKDALAKGADSGIFISNDSIDENNPLNIARAISNKIKDENFDLIISGLQSNDNGHAQVGLLIAEFLNTSHASLVMGTEILNEKTIKVKLELENGWFQWSELDLPSSLTIQSGINEPRYATLKGIMSVKNKTIDKIDLNDCAITDNGYEIEKIEVPSKSKETHIIEGSSDDIAEELLNVLKNELKVI